MKRVTNFLKEQIVLLGLAFLSFSTQPAILQAQEINPLPFTAPLSVSRGSVMPASPGAFHLDQADACVIAVEDWGWSSCEGIDAFIAAQSPELDTTLILKPDTAGFVKFDDWDGDERDDVVAQIEATVRSGLAAQGARLGYPVTFDGWTVKPTLDVDRKMMYYATASRWDGERSINIKATVFDRRGHVEFMIVPVAAEATPAEVEALILTSLSDYTPTPGEDYASFQPGDKVAAVGAVGVLAGLAGLKYGKGATAGLIGVLLLVLKKAWFVLLLPLIWLKSLFGRNKGGDV